MSSFSIIITSVKHTQREIKMKVTQIIKDTSGVVISSDVVFEGDEQECLDEVEVIMFQYDIQEEEISGDEMNRTVENNLVGYPKEGTSTFSIS